MKIFSTLGQKTFSLINEKNWNHHELGPIETWDHALVHQLNFILNSHQPCFIFWGPKAFCFYNDGYIPILGQKKHPASLGQPADEVWKEVWRTHTYPQYAAAMKGNATWNQDKLVPIERNGKIEEAYFTHGFSPIYCSDGSVGGVIVTALETTKSVVGTRNLNESAEQLSRALEVMKIGFYDWDMVTDHIVFNETMQKDWGISAGSALSDVVSHIHADDRDRVTQAINEAVSNKTPYQTSYRVVRPDKTIWIEARGLITYEDGKAVRFFGTSLDITDKVLLEKNLAQEKHTLDSIIRNSPSGMVIFKGEDLVFDYVNKAYAQLFGNAKLEGPLFQALPELKGQGYEELLQRVYLTGQSHGDVEAKVMIPDDDGILQERYFDYSYIQMKNIDGKPWGVFNHTFEVTDKVMSSRAKEKALRDLQDEKAYREMFVAAITHDLRTPLTSAKMSAQILERTDDPEIKRKFLNRIIISMERADEMIRDILDVNRIKSGERIPIEKREMNIVDCVKTVADETATIHGDRFEVHGPDELVGNFDQKAIRRILENLFTNALKYGDQNSPIIVETGMKKNSVMVSVTNKGPEIPADQRKKIFEPYHRVIKPGETNQKGWGIGLSLVRALTESHNGSIDVESCGFKGTTFTVNLPVA